MTAAGAATGSAPTTVDRAAQDHRVRVARERRERMRTHLLASVLHVCSNEAARAPAVIDDVVRHAGVSRGTFYKYFESLDAAVAEVVGRLGDEMTESIRDVCIVLPDPLDQVATGVQLWLIRALLDAMWAGFMARYGSLREGLLVTTRIQAAIRMGIETGDFAVPSVEVACEILIGIRYDAMRRIVGHPAGPDYVRAVAAMVLSSFGVPPAKAEKVVRRMYDRLKIEAPVHIPWWVEDARL